MDDQRLLIVFSISRTKTLRNPTEAFSICAYGEVSRTFLGPNITESDIFWSKETEIMATVCFGIKYGQTDTSGFVRGNFNFNLCHFMISYVRLQLSKYKAADIFGFSEA